MKKGNLETDIQRERMSWEAVAMLPEQEEEAEREAPFLQPAVPIEPWLTLLVPITVRPYTSIV